VPDGVGRNGGTPEVSVSQCSWVSDNDDWLYAGSVVPEDGAGWYGWLIKTVDAGKVSVTVYKLKLPTYYSKYHYRCIPDPKPWSIQQPSSRL
jgi:hypothetical protein